MENKLVTVGEFETGFEAELAKAQLEAEDIEAIVFGGELATNRGAVGPIAVELQVFEKDAQKAAQIIAAIEQKNKSENDIQT